MLALFIDDFKNKKVISLWTTSITISNSWLPMMAGSLVECIDSIFLPSPNLYMWLDCPKETYCWSSSLRLLTSWVSHSFLHTVLLGPQSNKAQPHVSDVKSLSSFRLSKSLWWGTTLFTMNVFSFSLSRQFCAQWLILWQMAHFVGFPYLSKGFLPCLDCGLFVGSCLAILQFRLFDCCCKYLGVWMVFFFCMTWFLSFCWRKYCCNSLWHSGILQGILGSDNQNLHHYLNQPGGVVSEKLVLVLYLSYWVQMWVHRKCQKKSLWVWF